MKAKKEQIPDRNIVKESKLDTQSISGDFGNIIIGIIVIILIAAGLIWIVNILL